MWNTLTFKDIQHTRLQNNNLEHRLLDIEKRSSGRIICRQDERGMRDNFAPHKQKTADICDHERRKSKKHVARTY